MYDVNIVWDKMMDFMPVFYKGKKKNLYTLLLHCLYPVAINSSSWFNALNNMWKLLIL